MIQCCITPPVSNLSLIREGDAAFCLAQLYVKYSLYREYFKRLRDEGWWIILDSGMGDHNPVMQDELFDVTLDLLPHEVIPVDTLFSKDKTLTNVFDFYDRLRREGVDDIVQIMGVPQGNTFDEWVECYKVMLSSPEVKVIGMSKLSIPWVVSRSCNDQNIGRDRNVMYDFLRNSQLIGKPLHFLGVGEFDEFLHYKSDPFIRSTDSCFTVWSAMNGVRFSREQFYGRIPTPKDYFERHMDDRAISLSIDNIKFFREILA